MVMVMVEVEAFAAIEAVEALLRYGKSVLMNDCHNPSDGALPFPIRGILCRHFAGHDWIAFLGHVQCEQRHPLLFIRPTPSHSRIRPNYQSARKYSHGVVATKLICPKHFAALLYDGVESRA